MRPTQILLSGAEELGKNNKYVASRGRPDGPNRAPFPSGCLWQCSCSPRQRWICATRGIYTNCIHLGTLATHGALSVRHPLQKTLTLKTSDETRTTPTRRHERHGSTNGRCMIDLWSVFLAMEDIVLTAHHRHPRPEAEGHRHLWHGPEPTEPFRWRRSRRCLQHMATIQRTGSLRCPTFHRCLLYHELGY